MAELADKKSHSLPAQPGVPAAQWRWALPRPAALPKCRARSLEHRIHETAEKPAGRTA
jgi:hypothetical protein